MAETFESLGLRSPLRFEDLDLEEPSPSGLTAENPLELQPDAPSEPFPSILRRVEAGRLPPPEEPGFFGRIKRGVEKVPEELFNLAKETVGAIGTLATRPRRPLTEELEEVPHRLKLFGEGFVSNLTFGLVPPDVDIESLSEEDKARLFLSSLLGFPPAFKAVSKILKPVLKPIAGKAAPIAARITTGGIAGAAEPLSRGELGEALESGTTGAVSFAGIEALAKALALRRPSPRGREVPTLRERIGEDIRRRIEEPARTKPLEPEGEPKARLGPSTPPISGGEVPPVEWLGWQEVPGREPMPLWNLTRDVGKHPKGSTISPETIRKLGFEPPEPPAPAPAPEAPMFERTPAGEQAVVPGAEGREIPAGALRAKTTRTEAPTASEGIIRFYHGEGGPQGAGGSGIWWTSNPERAASFGEKVSFVDVPAEIAAKAHAEAQKRGSGTGADAILPAEFLNKTQPAPWVKPTVFEIGEAQAAAHRAEIRIEEDIKPLDKGQVEAAIDDSLRREPRELGIPAIPEPTPRLPITAPEEPTTPGPVPGRADIVRDLSTMLDVAVRFGKVRGKGVMGFFRVKPEVIRTRFADDVEVTAHEVGHFLEKKLFGDLKQGGHGLTGAAFKDFQDELIPIATRHNRAGNKTVEGFAEFVRRYVTNEPEARRLAPRFYRFFEDRLETRHPEVRQILFRAREDFDRFMTAPGTARVRSHISRLPQKERMSARSLIDKFYTDIFDRVHPIARFKQEMIRRGAPIDAATDPELLARTFPGWIRKADWFIKRGPSDWNTFRKAGPGLEEVTAPIRAQWEDFWDYAAARRVIDDLAPRFGKDAIEKKTGLPLKDWQDTIRVYDGPQFRQVFDQVRKYQDQIFDYLADSYGIPEQQRAKIRELNQSFTPFYRVMDEPGIFIEPRARGGGGTFVDLGPGVRRFKGSQRPIVDPSESVIKNTFLFTNLAERNAVGRAIVELADHTSGAGKFVEKVPRELRPTRFELKEIKKTLEQAGVELSEIDLDTVATIFRPSPFKAVDEITIWSNGKPELYRVHPDLYRSLLNLDQEATGILTKILGVPAETLRVGATTTPEFVFRNPIRDQWSAAINAGLGVLTPFKTARGLFDVIGRTEMYDSWIRSGGGQATLVRLNRAEIIKRRNLMTQDPGFGGAKNIIRHPWQSIRLMAQITEEATRLGAFRAKLEGTSKGALLTAGGASREATIDFQRAGAKTASLRQIAAFWNANLQGLDKIRRVAIDDPLKFSIRVGIGITIPSIYLTLSQMNDARWKELPQWQKDISWVILTGPEVTDGQFRAMDAEEKRKLYEQTVWRIPKPWELGVLFGSIPERTIEWAAGQNPEIGKSLLQSLGAGGLGTLLPLPTAVVPLLENWANWSSFMDRPIVPRGLEELEPFLQVKPQTSELAKKIGETLDRSPAKIDNLIRGYTGGLGILASDTIGALMRSIGVVDLPPPPQRTLSDIPLIRGFTVRFPSSQARSIETFWEKYSESQRAQKSWKAMLKEGRTTDAERFYEQNRDQIERSKAFAAGAKTLRSYQQSIRGFWKDRNLTPEQKRKAIDLAYVEMIEVAQRMLQELYPPKPQ